MVAVTHGRCHREAVRDRWECERASAGGVVAIHGCTIEVDAVYSTRG
jgi:hypothetical protein